MILGFTIANFADKYYYLTLNFNISSLVSYTLIPILFSIGYFYSKEPFLIYKSLRYVILILFIVIIIQNFSPSFFDSFIVRTPRLDYITQEKLVSLSRGKRSLFAEPSFLSSFIFLYGLIMFILKSYVLKKIEKKNLLIFLSISLLICILSFSGQLLVIFLILSISSIVSFLGCMLLKIFKFLNNKKFTISNAYIRSLLLISSLISSLYFIFTNIFSKDLRVNFFITALQKDFSKVLIDQSLIWRLHAIYMPVMAPILEPLNITPNKSAYIILSRSIGYPLTLVKDIYIEYSDWFTNLTGLKDIILPTKTYSIFGNINYDFAFIGLLFAIYYFYKICSSIDRLIINSGDRENYFSRFLLPIIFILFSYINLSLLCPPYWFFSGMLYGIGKNKFEKN